MERASVWYVVRVRVSATVPLCVGCIGACTMIFKISFTRELTLATIDGIAQYYETVESQLQSAKKEERKRIQGMIQAMELDREDQMAEWDMAMQQHAMTFDMLLPNLFRYSLIVLLFLVVENKLGELCRAVKNVRGNIPSPPCPRNNVVNEYKKYLTKNAGISGLQWDKIHDLNKIRNCVVHASGKVKGFRYEPYLRQPARREMGLSISGDDYDPEDDLQPLYLDEDMLVLRPEYCKGAIKNIRDFFEELCDAVPLPRLTINQDS
jgi:hypothetical protein